MLLKMIASVYYRRCESYRMYLKGYSPHQSVMIVCKLKHPNFTVPKHTDVIHDWWALVGRWLFMPFS